mmetsp:Transcript_6274/g.10589  ORF Transcript_6274/g.10589 Transcript_6274/m.10589 type:complete len:216 (+) Transcript_6274:170-817(+)
MQNESGSMQGSNCSPKSCMRSTSSTLHNRLNTKICFNNPRVRELREEHARFPIDCQRVRPAAIRPPVPLQATVDILPQSPRFASPTCTGSCDGESPASFFSDGESAASFSSTPPRIRRTRNHTLNTLNGLSVEAFCSPRQTYLPSQLPCGAGTSISPSYSQRSHRSVRRFRIRAHTCSPILPLVMGEEISENSEILSEENGRRLANTLAGAPSST